VLGSDPVKHKMQRDVRQALAEGKQYFNNHPEITSSELFKYAESLAQKFDWVLGGPIAGHFLCQFPHQRIPSDKVSLYVHPDSHLPMR
jgi:Xaa-Pro dipeptidase